MATCQPHIALTLRANCHAHAHRAITLTYNVVDSLARHVSSAYVTVYLSTTFAFLWEQSLIFLSVLYERGVGDPPLLVSFGYARLACRVGISHADGWCCLHYVTCYIVYVIKSSVCNMLAEDACCILVLSLDWYIAIAKH